MPFFGYLSFGHPRHHKSLQLIVSSERRGISESPGFLDANELSFILRREAKQSRG